MENFRVTYLEATVNKFNQILWSEQANNNKNKKVDIIKVVTFKII